MTHPASPLTLGAATRDAARDRPGLPAAPGAPAATAAPGAAVEVASWPPLEVVEVDGWRVGLSGGLTRRANSALPPAGAADVDAAVTEGVLDRVEALYAGRGLPAVVRVGADAASAGLDARLAARGYVVAADADVMVAPVGALPAPAGRPDVVVESHDGATDDWLATWLGVKAQGTDAGLARRLVEGCPARYLLARTDGCPAAAVRVALVDGWAALSCLVVAPTTRRLGLGRHLTLLAVQQARRRGAQRVLLQVETRNAAARGLYRGLGLVVADRYHYRERHDLPTTTSAGR